MSYYCLYIFVKQPIRNQYMYVYKVYLRRDQESRLVACFLDTPYMVAMLAPAILVVVINSAVTAIAVWVAHRATGRR